MSGEDSTARWLNSLNLYEQAYMIYLGAMAIGFVVMMALEELGEDPES